jgi:hypothetical protein
MLRLVGRRSFPSLACMYSAKSARIATRVAFATMGAVLFTHLYFAMFKCQSATLTGTFILAAIVLSPAILYTAISWPWGAVAACLVVVGPVIWAYRAECVLPYAGGGAAMAFVPVLMFAVPGAFILGGFVEHAARE